jgi:hypothetical protein
LLTGCVAQFLRNPQLEAVCQQYNASTLTEIHSSFCNKDRIAAIIQKQRLLSYPNGQDINGLIFLENTDQHIKVRISKVLIRWLVVLTKPQGLYSKAIS